ncbi:thymidine kinase 2, mitochondrial [Cichlidogyrus casuarinus]|uniref:Thymidine kinase 2, mitochondrial n=1 Tax=Cichlidogyrus casuarinus TaxID=1844966 RepID=A0ABD2QG29_9PLAT
MYRDTIRYAVPFQAHAVATILHRQMTPQVSPIRLIERSIFSSKLCFVEALRQNQLISDADNDILCKFYDWVSKLPIIQPNMIIYLRASPQVCFERMQARNRTSEEHVTLSYLEQLHDLHEKWLMQTHEKISRVPVIVFDCNKQWEDLKLHYESRLNEILSPTQ